MQYSQERYTLSVSGYSCLFSAIQALDPIQLTEFCPLCPYYPHDTPHFVATDAAYRQVMKILAIHGVLVLQLMMA